MGHSGSFGIQPIVLTQSALLGVMLIGPYWQLAFFMPIIAAVSVFNARSEERSLRRDVPGYGEYAARTAAIIPFVF